MRDTALSLDAAKWPLGFHSVAVSMGTRRAMARGMGRNRADAEAAAVRNALQKLRREIVRSQRGA